MCVQGGHAMDIVYSLFSEYSNDNTIAWAEDYRRKIVLKIDNLEKLLNLQECLKENKILCYKIIDKGFTEFNGETITGLVVPPYYSDERMHELNRFKRLQLWK